jgi:hypothetical protein
MSDNDDREPRWANDLPPGFTPDGKSLIVPLGTPIKFPELKIRGVDGTLYTPEEYEALLAEGETIDEEDDDLSDLDDIAKLAG